MRKPVSQNLSILIYRVRIALQFASESVAAEESYCENLILPGFYIKLHILLPSGVCVQCLVCK